MNTSVQEHRAPHQQMHHGVEGENPTQGQKAFAAMKQKEVRKQSTTTRRALGQGNQAVAKSDQIPGGRDQQSNWTRMPQGRNQGGEGGKSQRGKRTNPQPNKKSTTGSPSAAEGAQDGAEKPTAQKPNTHQQTETSTRRHKEEPRDRKRNQKEGKESTAHKKATRKEAGPQKDKQKTPTAVKQEGAEP